MGDGDIGKLQLEGVEWVPGPSRNNRNWPKVQQKQVMKSERFLSEEDLYNNPDPNELEVFINDRKVVALVDPGVQLSSISISLDYIRFGRYRGFNNSLFGICGNKIGDSRGQSLWQEHFDVGSSR